MINLTQGKIKIIIADDNVEYCNELYKELSRYDEIEILGMANSDEDEINMIEILRPEIVITDIVRNGKATGLDIIKNYESKKNTPYFLVITYFPPIYLLMERTNLGGYIKKSNDLNYEEIVNLIKIIRKFIIMDIQIETIKKESVNNNFINLGKKERIRFIKKLKINLNE